MSIRWGSLLFLALLGVLFFADLLLHPTQTLYSDYSDLLTLHFPSRRFLVRSWQETGELPLWCPYHFAGMPFVHDIQVSAFYPFHWPLYLVPENWLGAALSWLVVFHTIAAGWCMYAYAWHQGLRGAAALVAAIGYMFAGKWLLHILAGGHYNMVPLAWLPLVLLWLEQAIQRGSLLRATWAGAVFSLLILGAYPYLILYAGLFVAVWTLGTALEESGYLGGSGVRSRGRTVAALGRWLGLGAWTMLIALALGAVQLLPGLEMSAGASRSAGVAVSLEMCLDAFRSLVGLVGPALSNEPNAWENRAGLGVLWVTLAALAPLLGRGRVRYQAAVCLLMVGFVLGGAIAVQWLPGFRLFRLPSRMYLVAAFPVALLAGRTIQSLLSAPGLKLAVRRQCRRVLVKITALVVCLAGVFALALTAKQGDVRGQFHPYWATLLITVPCAFWLLGKRDPRAAAWIAILTIDLAALTWPLVAVRSEADIFTPSECVRYLAEQRAKHGRVLDFNPEECAANDTPLWPGLPAVLQIEPIRGFNPIDVLRYKEYLQFITDEDRPLGAIDGMFTGPILGTFPIKNQTLADLLGIRYLVQPTALPLAVTVQDRKGNDCWIPVFDDPAPTAFNFISVQPSGRDCGPHRLPPYRVYENKGSFPRAFIVSEAGPLPDRPDVLAALKATDFRRRVLLENFSKESASPGRASFRAAEIRDYLPNRVTLDLEGGEAGFLVLTDIWYPGWTCTVDGQATPIYRANYLFRAVELPAGAKTVVFAFAPASYSVGKTISGWAALAVLSLTLLSLVTKLRWPDRPLERKSISHAVAC